MLFTSLLQGALSPPRSSCREAQMPPSRRPTNIHSLPVELVTAIFVHGASLDYPYDASPFLIKPGVGYVPAPSSNIQVVAHVCRYWRQVALSTQPLWTTLHFRSKEHIPRAVAYLERTRTHLLDILIDTVAADDHIEGVTLNRHELGAIFAIIAPFVHRWRTFHLKICDNDCKIIARQHLGTCGPGPKLETLQLYHFEDFRTTQMLFLATYRPPVTIFNNDLPRLKNVSLIGVNLPWDSSLYLRNLDHLELALHLDNVRPPYHWWGRMLRASPHLKSLTLHYSGPREGSESNADLTWPPAKIHLPQLSELSFTDLDPEYLCNLFKRLEVPNLKKLTLDLYEQDFTPFVEFLTTLEYTSSSATPTLSTNSGGDFPQLPIQVMGQLQVLIIRGLECSLRSWAAFLHSMKDLRVLEVAFAKTSEGFWDVFTHKGAKLHLPVVEEGNQHDMTVGGCNCGRRSPALLPRLEAFKLSGISGEQILSALYFRYQCSGRCVAESEKWMVRWSERRRRKDPKLDALVDRGYWSHKDVCRTTRVVIEHFDDEEDLEDIDDDSPCTSDDDGEA